jgi:hypothetical protein
MKPLSPFLLLACPQVASFLSTSGITNPSLKNIGRNNKLFEIQPMIISIATYKMQQRLTWLSARSRTKSSCCRCCKTFFFVTEGNKARVFVPGMFFQEGVIFENKAGDEPSEALTKPHFIGWFLALLTLKLR